MSTDLNLIEASKVRRARLTASLVQGSDARHRTRLPLLQRLIIGCVIAAVASAACVGVSFVQKILADQKAEKERQQQAHSLVVPISPASPDPARIFEGIREDNIV